MTETTRPAVLFVCVHNAGRSQMAAGYLQALAGDRIDVFSAGSEPGDRVNPAAVAVMAEEGIDLSSATPRVLTVDAVRRDFVAYYLAHIDEHTLPYEGIPELLDELHARYSMVLVIGPGVAQTVDLEMLAARVDSIVFVAPRDGRPLPVALRTIETLREADAPILGLVSV